MEEAGAVPDLNNKQKKTCMRKSLNVNMNQVFDDIKKLFVTL